MSGLHPFGIPPDFIRCYEYFIPSGFLRITSGVMGISSLRDSSGFHPGVWVSHPFGIPPDYIRGYVYFIPSGFLRISSGVMCISSLRDSSGFHPGL